MKRFAALFLVAAMAVSLTGCSWLEKFIAPPTAPAQPTAPAPAEPQQPEEKPEFSLEDAAEILHLGGVKVSITRPVVTLANGDASEAVNQYFQLLGGKVRDYAEGDVAAMALPYDVTAGYKLSYVSAHAISFGWTVETHTDSEGPSFSTHSAASFDIKTGKLLTFDGIFGAHAEAVKKLFLQQAKAVVEAALKDDAYYFDEWPAALEAEFSPERFFLTEHGVAVFYPRESLGTLTEAQLSWEALAPHLAVKL